MQEKETLQEQIEIARKRLDEAYAFGNDIEGCYELSREVDRMIERYLDLVRTIK